MSLSIAGVTGPSAAASRFSAGTGSPNTNRPPDPISTPTGRVRPCAAPPENVAHDHFGVPVVHQLYNVSCPALCTPPITIATGTSPAFSISHGRAITPRRARPQPPPPPPF